MGGRAKQAESDDATAEHVGWAGGDPTGAWEALGGRVGAGTWAPGRGKLGGLVLVNLVPVNLVNGNFAFYAAAGCRNRHWAD